MVPIVVESARADDALSVDESFGHDSGEPLLTLDLVPRPGIAGLGVTEDTDRITLVLGQRATLTLSGASWRGYTDAVPVDGNEDELVRGARAALRFRYDLGWLQLDASASQNAMSSRYGSGTYRDVSLTISKSHRFSRWVTGWIGLSLANRQWTGQPPVGEEQSSTTLMLSIGGTFR